MKLKRFATRLSSTLWSLCDDWETGQWRLGAWTKVPRPRRVCRDGGWVYCTCGVNEFTLDEKYYGRLLLDLELQIHNNIMIKFDMYQL